MFFVVCLASIQLGKKVGICMYVCIGCTCKLICVYAIYMTVVVLMVNRGRVSFYIYWTLLFLLLCFFPIAAFAAYFVFSFLLYQLTWFFFAGFTCRFLWFYFKSTVSFFINIFKILSLCCLYEFWCSRKKGKNVSCFTLIILN